VNSAKSLYAFRHHALYIFHVGNVYSGKCGLRARFFQFIHQVITRFFGQIGQKNSGTFLRKFERRSASYAGATACNKYCLVFK
jgi:hypothetical protein